jgi:hypothetical protein
MRAEMNPTSSTSRASWHAEVRWQRRCYSVEDALSTVESEAKSAVEIMETPQTKAQPQILETIHIVRECFVDIFKPGGARLSFRVNRRTGRSLTFTDPREQWTGTAGTRGIWGTLPEQPAGKPRSLTPTAFREEVARFIGAERAEEIVRELAP